MRGQPARQQQVACGAQQQPPVLSLGAKQLAHAVGYVKSQKAHHSEGTTIRMLEQARQEDDGPPAWRLGGVVSPHLMRLAAGIAHGLQGRDTGDDHATKP
jgi:hypothetical protein